MTNCYLILAITAKHYIAIFQQIPYKKLHTIKLFFLITDLDQVPKWESSQKQR